MNLEDLIQGCIQKDRRAQKLLVDRYSSYLYGVCIRYTGDRYLAKDCLQESLLRILQKIHLYEEQGNFKAWMAKVTAMKCLEIMRKEKKHGSEELMDYNEQFTHEDRVYDTMQKKEVFHFVERLPSNYRIALNMFLVEGYSHKEISQHLGISEGSSRSLVSRGRGLIQKAFCTKPKELKSCANKMES